MDSGLTASQRNQLIEFARSMIERARHAGLPATEPAPEARPLPLHDEPDPKTIVELLAQHRRFFDTTRAQLARELDTVLLVVERLEQEIAVLRGEVQGLRQERQDLLARVRRSEQDLAAAAEAFTQQISAEVSSIAGRLSSYIDNIDNAAAGAARYPSASPGGAIEIDGGPGEPAGPPPKPAPNGDARAEAPVLSVAASPAKQSPAALLGLVRGRVRRGRASRPEADAVAAADRARDARDWKEAARLYQKALAIAPGNAAIWVQYGHALKECGNKADAENAYRKSIELDPQVADTHLQLGHVLKLQGKRGGAAAAYLRALACDPALKDATIELLGLGWTETRIRSALQ